MELRHFHGMSPKTPLENLTYNYAELALDVDLSHGTLKPWRAPLLLKATSPFTKRIHQVGCCWFEFASCVSIAEWTVDCKRLYVTGDETYPTVMPIKDNCETGCGKLEKLRLGIPAPKDAIQAKAFKFSIPTNASHLPDAEERESRAYVYTYVNCLGEEGPPSYPSNHVDTDDGSPVSLTGFSVPPKEYGIEQVNVYRMVTGMRASNETQQGPMPHITDYFLVATIPVGQATHIDGGLNVDMLGDPLTTLDVLEPPEGLRGIIAIPNSRMLAGFVGNTLCITMNNQPWNWPLSQRYNLDDTIIAIEAYAGRLYVMTDGHPYSIDLGDGVDARACRAIIRHSTPMPMVTCCSTDGAITTPVGVFYVSDRGIVLMGAGEPKVISSPWFATDDWRKLKPQTMRLGWHDGRLFVTSDDESYIFFMDSEVFGDNSYSRLTKLSIKPTHYHTGRNGELFILYDHAIHQWNAGLQVMPYTWKGAILDTKRYGYFGAVRLWADGAVSVSIFAERIPIFNDILLLPNTAVRLPRYGHHLHHQVAFTGTYEVQSFEMAQSRWELSST
ncbi:hypothetical protein V757_11225 [Pelistega indica]|uniref:Uncharacterized protein n=1 Tax=Pelistega indica TaxID=1414851 RepID=V8FV25_9BURK|nr:hypothetical protein [Pelistega indica]ETD67553.1 hypothetical protein V757_11225 [Pelistega indica]